MIKSKFEEQKAKKEFAQHLLRDGLAQIVDDVEDCKKLTIQSKAFESTAKAYGVRTQFQMNKWCTATDSCFTFIRINSKDIKKCIE